jgi:hypothetical protein
VAWDELYAQPIQPRKPERDYSMTNRKHDAEDLARNTHRQADRRPAIERGGTLLEV